MSTKKQEETFQSEMVVEEFKKLFKQAFPKGCDVRQKADLMGFFLAGYQAAGIDQKKAVMSLGTEGGLLFMEEIIDDNHARAQFLIKCMIDEDYSHSMFEA